MYAGVFVGFEKTESSCLAFIRTYPLHVSRSRLAVPAEQHVNMLASM